MTIRMVKHSDTKAELRPEGRIDSSNAQQVQDLLIKTAGEYDEILLNLAKLDYISSAGLRALLMTQKTMLKKGGRLTLKNVGETVREVFEMTGFVTLLNIEN